MRQKKRTIRQWEKVCGIHLLNLDGFDTRDKKLFERLFTEEQFKYAAEQCTVLVPEHENKPKMTKRTKQLLWWGVIFLPMPTLATVLLFFFYNVTTRWVRMKWFIPATILFGALVTFAIQPITPLIAGPGYPWYELLNLTYHLSIRGLAACRFLFLHQSLNLTGTTIPLFSTYTIHGVHVNLYFGIPQAVTSSILWAIFIVCVKDLLLRIKQYKHVPPTSRYHLDESLKEDA